MNRLFQFLFVALASGSLSSCIDVVPLDLPEGRPILVVDGQITDQPTPPVVQLSLSQAYFGGSEAPAVRGAVVGLVDNLGHRDVLRETTPGRYVGTGAVQGRIGGHYTLTIAANGQTYRAETDIKRTPAIDSISVIFKTARPGVDEGYYPLYNGAELPGVGDYYRFKVYKNGSLRNEPGDLLVVSDELVDGSRLVAIDLTTKPFSLGDKVKVEMNALPRDYFYFLNEMVIQINNVGLFATSPANVRTNVYNMQAGADQPAAGYFAGYPVRTDSVTIR
jgi:hypothetical protein